MNNHPSFRFNGICYRFASVDSLESFVKKRILYAGQLARAMDLEINQAKRQSFISQLAEVLNLAWKASDLLNEIDSSEVIS